MSEAVITRCPGCRTAFRVTPEQLALREGQVRCGHCRAVFDANDHRVAGEARKPEAAPAPEVVTPEPQVEPAIVAPEPQVEPAIVAPEPQVEPAIVAADADVTAAVEPETVPTEAPATVEPATAAIDRARPHEWRPRKRLHEQPKTLYALATVALVALLGVQGLFEYRDALAAHAPFARPLLDAACRVAGCSIAPLRDASALFIEASDLEADPAHKGLLKLSATVRNRASYPIAFS